VQELKVLSLSPEVTPLVKTGGLADVAGALPAALNRLGLDVRLMLPLYRSIRKGNFELRPVLKNLGVPFGASSLSARVMETRIEGDIPLYLIDREDMYDRPNIYGDDRGDYYDNLERFTFFSNAALKLTEAVSFAPDLIHCHDWQTGLVPALIKGPYGDSSLLAETPTVFTIHNLGYQGLFSADKLPVTGIPRKGFFHPEGVEYWGKMSLLKAGIVYSEAITTVSPTYAREIQTPEYGMGMEGILYRRRAVLHGILNGVDYRLWDPAVDTHIPANYSPEEITGKGQCKKSLLREMGLDPDLNERPLLGMVSRLDAQKGLDLLLEILNGIMALDAGLVVLGSGGESIQQALREVTELHNGSVGLFIGFDEPLAHRIMAGADMLLIPSRYEPCGLTQMYALKYGTVPVVRATGGLDDTIIPFDITTKEGNGFKFGPYEPDAFLSAIRQAVDLFDDKEAWKRLMANGMKADFSWDRSARNYLEIYRSLVEG
jgi:starch synthase